MGRSKRASGWGWASADDIVAHELHPNGVQDHEDRLFYHDQSGAINESFADIFGEYRRPQADGQRHRYGRRCSG